MNNPDPEKDTQAGAMVQRSGTGQRQSAPPVGDGKVLQSTSGQDGVSTVSDDAVAQGTAGMLSPSGPWEKVVIHLDGELTKGFFDSQQIGGLEALVAGAADGMPDFLRVRPLGSEMVEEVPTGRAKAVFFVRDFSGNSQHRDIQFHRRAPLIKALWIRVQFLDGEIMEGFISNNIDAVVNSGFFIQPTDPYSNNRLVYVVKNSLKDFRVLGLRNL